ncbi:hypothetical protein J5N97_029907 [Dioscorea zingiberensis]|uniref:beta-galactosidase n=1 Tax=Dioscorea zingiberensis TaxID=325984 RepID=A0A9D5BWP2_9LILI|nr:hypothetical protein J5N97_029907 [Dioscorea zingiberensis]
MERRQRMVPSAATILSPPLILSDDKGMPTSCPRFKKWGQPDPHQCSEDVAFAVARFFQSGGTFQNYYMHHEGTNFGPTSRGPYITASYDFDAPLDAYGNLRQPKWGHLKELHFAIKMMENALLQGIVNNTDLDNGVVVTKYTVNESTSGCFLSNINTTSNFTVSFEGNVFTLHVWSVSVALDCKKEVYNTARVEFFFFISFISSVFMDKSLNFEHFSEEHLNVETHSMVKNPGTSPAVPLRWSWIAAIIDDALKRLGSFSAKKLTL